MLVYMRFICSMYNVRTLTIERIRRFLYLFHCNVRMRYFDLIWKTSQSIKGAAELRKRWDQPILGPGYWNTPKYNVQTKERHAEAKAVPVSHYAAALADVQAGREAQGTDK